MRRIPLLLFIGVSLAVAIGLATAVSPWASPHPDGLERVAEDNGFAGAGTLASLQESSPVPDYAFPGIEDPRVATGIAGFAGTLGIFLCMLALAWLLRRLRPARPEAAQA